MTLRERRLDFLRCAAVFDGPHIAIEDDRKDYGELRYFTVALVDRRMVTIVWTPRGEDQRVISMREANEPEQRT